jgi:SMC interacting uncharacterized protein involved in chromosome segregation
MSKNDNKKKEKKIYLTKNRKKALHTAISIDEILYRTFEQMQQHIEEYARHLNKTYKNVIQVRSKDMEGNFYIEQIIDVQKVDGEGLIITVHKYN